MAPNQRYTVTIVTPDHTGVRPVLLIPFTPSAIVTTFIDELYTRAARRGIAVAPSTHIATLHLDSETGAIIDCEDVLSDVVMDPERESIFAVFHKEHSNGEAPSEPEPTLTRTAPPASSDADHQAPSLSVRVVTAATAKNRATCPVLELPLTATIKQLHQRVAEKLEIQANFEKDPDSYECNCTLATKLSEGPGTLSSFLVVHGRSNVERLQLDTPTEAGVKQALRHHFGAEFEAHRRAGLIGARVQNDNPASYKTAPVVAMCSKSRHTPAHARVNIDESGPKLKLLDLHTSELPMHAACGAYTLGDAGIAALASNGTVDIFAVHRTSAAANRGSSQIGKSSIFRSRSHWEPAVSQSDRGIAIFLSSLRVFASLAQDYDERLQDAVLHAFDLLTNFPPALRALKIIIDGKTPTAVDSAALASAMYEILDSFAPTNIIGTDHSRVFELARLFFGFVLDKARTLKLPEAESAALPYSSAFSLVDIRDFRTNEAVMKAISTSNGLVEATFFDAFQQGAVLADSHLQAYMRKTDENLDATKARLALLSGGTVAEISAFALGTLLTNYRYPDNGNVRAALDLTELSELNHLTELCGRHKLAVHKPSQLSSAVAPSLTFDRNAHLAVYTGEEACGEPGRSSTVFRPNHGDEAIDASVIEQLIAPILQRYEQDGTAVFDALGGAAVRRLQQPDEILMFCVDCSASMRRPTDFPEVNDDDESDDEAADMQDHVEPEFYSLASFADLKEQLNSYEGFNDMVAIIAGTSEANISRVTKDVVEVLRIMLSSEIIKKSERITDRRSYARGWNSVQREIRDLEAELKKLKTLWAGLKTHEQPVCDFLTYRATAASSHEISQRWTWSLGEDVPESRPLQEIPTLAADITELHHTLSCPISHTLMTDAVKAADGHTYSHQAISQWFAIRKSSPMTGLQLQDTSLTENEEICEAANRWIDGDGVPGRELTTGEDAQPSKRARTSNDVEVTFDSRLGSFSRQISSTTTLKDLYRLAFRGLKAKALVFQLSTERYGPLAPSPEATVSSRSIKDGDHITVRIAEDEPDPGTATVDRSDKVLVKVYDSDDGMMFGFWVGKTTAATLTSVLWKYWRHRFQNSTFVYPTEMQLWTNMRSSGDGLLSGTPEQDSTKLASFLTRVHCFGHLGEEEVYREEVGGNGARSASGSHPLVLKVQINPPWKPHKANNRLTRLDVLKQTFEAVINRMLAYNFKTHVGLVTFSSSAKVTMGISHVLENFRRATNGMEAEGDTALWDALALAQDQLTEYSKKFPGAKKRIICISDGLDTKSTANAASDIMWKARQTGIAIDTISLGYENNLDLRTVAYLLGCYRFHPTSLANALAICELEPFLALFERPPIVAPAGIPQSRAQFMGYFPKSRSKATSTVVTADNVPPRKAHPNLEDDFVELTTATTARNINSGSTGANRTRSNLRLMNEMRSMAALDHPTYDVYVSESDMSFFKVVMSGPEDSPYSDGAFLLYLHADEGYPTFAPKARFITKIKHPNVNAHGRICHSIFDRDWTSDTSMTTLLDTVHGLLLQPERTETVNTTTTLDFHHDEVEYAEEVREHVGRHASQTREEWRKELLGEFDDEDEDEDEDDNMAENGDVEEDEDMQDVDLDEEGPLRHYPNWE